MAAHTEPLPTSTGQTGGNDDQPNFPANLFQSSSWSLQDLKHLQEIGKGKDTVIYSASCPRLGGRIAAVKVYDRSKVAPTKLRAIKREIAMMLFFQKKKVPNVVDFYGAFQDDRYFYIVMEYCPGGDLLEHLLRDRKAMSERRAALEVARPLLTTLAHLHTLNIIHRDIKLENIFMDATGRVRLGDFGLTMSMHQEAAISPVGTVEYMAPEVVALPPVDMVTSGRVRASSLTPNNEKVDIWALGVTLFELVTGKLPFEGKDKSEIKASITAYNLASFPSYISANCQTMIRSMLAYDHKDRPTAEQLLQHPYLLAYAAGRGSPGPVVALHARAGLLTVPNGSGADPIHPSSKSGRVSPTQQQWPATAEGARGSPTPHALASSFPLVAMSASSREISASNLARGSTQRQTSGGGAGVVPVAAAKASSGAWAALRRISAGHKSISAYSTSAQAPTPMEEESSSDGEQGAGSGVKRVIRRLFSRQSAPHRMDVDTVGSGTKGGVVGEGAVRASVMS